jgi:nucleotide-binding universal stress UspA family protein
MNVDGGSAMRDFQIKRILVPTDLSQPGSIALRYARLFAERFSAGLLIVYAEPMVIPAGGLGVMPFYADSPGHLRDLEHEIRTYASEPLDGLTYEVVATGGDPVPSIVHEAKEREADLIVMATHGLRGWRRAILGSITEGVLHQGTSPVLSISRPNAHPSATPGVTKIVCPINFTDAARESLDYAAHLAASFDCELNVVHVVEHTDPMRAAVAEEDVRSWIVPAIQERCTVRQLVMRGGAAERVLDCAEDIGADLLVIGAQQKLFRDVTTIGTTTERLVRFARMPVLTVPNAVEAKTMDALAPSVVHIGEDD